MHGVYRGGGEPALGRLDAVAGGGVEGLRVRWRACESDEERDVFVVTPVGMCAVIGGGLRCELVTVVYSKCPTSGKAFSLDTQPAPLPKYQS